MTLVEQIRRRLCVSVGATLILPALLAGCGRDAAPAQQAAAEPLSGPQREYGLRPRAGKLLGEDLSLDSLLSGDAFGADRGQGLPVNKYLWQATLDTLDFLPLVSTDPFTGVIATDWAGTPQAPNERLKVTAYLTRPELEASSLRVAVYRQISDGEGRWQPAPVSPETALRLENAILARARQLRVADLQAGVG